MCLVNIPHELLILTAYGLPYKELTSLCSTSKQFSEICQNSIFWINYIQKNIGEVFNTILIDKSIDELKDIVAVFKSGQPDVATILTILKYDSFEVFATLLFLVQFTNLPENFDVKGKFEKLIKSVDENSSQNLKDLALILLLTGHSHSWMSIDVWDRVTHLLTIGANPSREYGFSQLINRGNSSLGMIIEYAGSPGSLGYSYIKDNYVETFTLNCLLSALEYTIPYFTDEYVLMLDDINSQYELKISNIIKIESDIEDDVLPLLLRYLHLGGSIITDKYITNNPSAQSLLNDFPEQISIIPSETYGFLNPKLTNFNGSEIAEQIFK